MKFERQKALGISPGIIGLLSIMLVSCGSQNQSDVSFKDQLLPLLLEKCMPCHAPGGQGHQKNGLLLESYSSLMKGKTTGSVVTPGNRSKSLISLYIHPSPDAAMQMPRNGQNRLTKTEVDLIDNWISQGAKDN